MGARWVLVLSGGAVVAKAVTEPSRERAPMLVCEWAERAGGRLGVGGAWPASPRHARPARTRPYRTCTATLTVGGGGAGAGGAAESAGGGGAGGGGGPLATGAGGGGTGPNLSVSSSAAGGVYSKS